MDGNHFDNLSRSVAGGLTRRTFLGGIVGTAAAMAFRRSAVVPRTSTAAAATCGLALYPLTLSQVSACREAGQLAQVAPPSTNNICDVPLPDFRPSENATPDTSNITAYLISSLVLILRRIVSPVLRNAYDSFGTANFRPACRAHDRCFTTCGSVQQACDAQFYLDLVAACTSSYASSVRILGLCVNQAALYWRGVSLQATYYDNDQQRACGCCVDPDCLLNGGGICNDGSCKVCESGILDEGTCECVTVTPSACSGGTCADAVPCGENGDCICFETTEGTGFCHTSQSCGGSALCQTSEDCSDPNFPVCSKVTCCGTDGQGQGICIQPCGAGSGVAARAVAPDGPTTTTPFYSTPAGGPNCPEGQIVCLDACIDPLTDPVNCGDCGIACGPDQTCLDGICIDMAPEPTASVIPTEEPPVEPTTEPTPTPTEEPPTAVPTQEPTVAPTEQPTAIPTEEPDVEPSGGD